MGQDLFSFKCSVCFSYHLIYLTRHNFIFLHFEIVLQITHICPAFQPDITLAYILHIFLSRPILQPLICPAFQPDITLAYILYIFLSRPILMFWYFYFIVPEKLCTQ